VVAIKKFNKYLNIKILLPVAGVAFVVLMTTIVYYSTNQVGIQKPAIKDVQAENIATSSSIAASPLASPKPISIPANYGRQVRVPILYYHYIGNNPNPEDKARYSLSIAPDKFEEEMDYLAKQGYTPITLDTMYAGLKGNASLPAKPVILTFDDGYIDFYLNAYPVLKRYNFHAVVFIPTGLMDQGYYLHWNQIKEMDATGLITFEAHSVTHPNLVSLSQNDIEFQVTESKKVLESQLGKPVNFFCYPYGSSNEVSWTAVKNAGYLGAVGTWGGVIESEGNIFNMPRERMGGDIDITTFASKL
jgi:peptidoglycan/xylan/chitin deacetylase (PgdA/CDA1 family)